MPSDNQFICLFKNNNTLLSLNKNIWYTHDDLNGFIKYINEISFLNILQSSNPCLFLYTKKNI